MTLREEIKLIIHDDVFCDQNFEVWNEDKATDEILKMFEKRLDKFIEENEEYDESNVLKILKEVLK